MKILILNWRSLKDPRSGGAEIATFEHAKRWVKNHGAEVFWLSPKYRKDVSQETIEGVNFVYIDPILPKNPFLLGLNFLLFVFNTYKTYKSKFRGAVDIVIDQHHGIPLFTPLYVKEKIVLYIHEVAGKVWFKMFSFPLSILGYLAEMAALSLYKNTVLVIAGAQSTANELKNIGFNKELLNIVGYGLNIPRVPRKEKEENLTIIYLNRLVKMKGIERALEMFSLLLKQVPEAKLWVVGKGDEKYVNYLKGLCRTWGIQDNVHFYGFVSEEEKYTLLSKAHILINTSYKEGWGLCNLEANVMGTPAIAFRVHGNIDSIKEGISGWLIEEGRIEEMAKKIINIYKEKSILESVSKSCMEYAKGFSWDIKCKEFYEILS